MPKKPSNGIVPMDSAEKSERHRKKLRASGLKEVRVNVPNNQTAIEAVKALAKELRNET